jgi:hypothetical protein
MLLSIRGNRSYIRAVGSPRPQIALKNFSGFSQGDGTLIQHEIYEFGPYVLDSAQMLLRRDGSVVPLQPRALEMLLVLVRRRGEVVSKQELMEAVWPDSFVEEGNLTQNIFLLRRELGKTKIAARETRHDSSAGRDGTGINPVIAASGTFGYGIEFEEIVALERIGGFVTKGISLEPMAGHAAPRIVQTAAGMFNAIGLQNVGVEDYIQRKLPPLARYPECKVIVNVFGYTVGDYIAVIERLNQAEGIAAYELNVSCPNVHAGRNGLRRRSGLARISGQPGQVGLHAAADRQALAQRDLHRPHGQSRRGLGADAVSLTNTFLAMSIDAETRQPAPQQHHRRPVRPGHQAHRPAHGV